HVAVQLSQSSSDLAEQSAMNAYKAIENANILGEASIRSAYNAMEDANNYLKKVKESPFSTELQIAQAESSLHAAEGAYEQAKESSRSQSDAAEGAYEQALINQSITYWNNINSTLTAQIQINIMKKSIEQAETQLEISRINYELTKLGTDDYQINAPFNGVVLNANFSEGETANPAMAAITIISDEFVIKSDINETDIAKLKTGQEVQLILDAYPEMSFEGTVSEISSISKKIAEIVTFEIIIKPEEEMKNYLKYGLSANITVIISKVENVLYVPIQSVYEEEDKSYVDILTGDGQIKRTEVTTGMYNYDYIEIKSGLSEGDMIVTSRIEDMI
ncbi:MAG: efflux RND transporter periplasmic adaptor subunit, partial [Actinobacteria bacterium]|nr:efflux RND transporter periplasmic adaptor subunit [Actinomycetota bacterium]